MTIYNINFGIGWASSGVEYAQKYRAELLRCRKEKLKFIFLDFISNENIQSLTHHLGFKDSEIIWLYQYFTDIKIAPTSITINDIIASLEQSPTRIEKNGKIKRLYFQNETNFITCYLKDEQHEYVDRAEFVSEGMLIRKDYYSYVRVFSEFYAPKDNRAKLYMRQFYNENGSIAYEEYISSSDSELDNIYVINKKPLYGKNAFIEYFMKSLDLSVEDIVIIDRATRIGQIVLENKGASKVGVVVHAEHYSENSTNEHFILWNNYYEYQFMQADEIDFFITATERQNEILSEQMKYYLNKTPKIYTIPVGSLDKLRTSKKRKSYSIITASRLANEKHVDWLVRAVVKARTHLPVTFDIYGEGGEKIRIKELIKELNAEDYIQMKGHVDVTEIYKDYQLFLSASQSEGFGLTLMEAVGSGLGLIGFDVNYGNPTFIKDGYNGFLIPFNSEEESIEAITDKMNQMIVEFFNKDITVIQQNSYEIAGNFSKESVEEKWRNLINEVRND